jgi:hypothetical protein
MVVEEYDNEKRNVSPSMKRKKSIENKSKMELAEIGNRRRIVGVYSRANGQESREFVVVDGATGGVDGRFVAGENARAGELK